VLGTVTSGVWLLQHLYGVLVTTTSIWSLKDPWSLTAEKKELPSDYAVARAAAMESGKPIHILLTGPNCIPCDRLKEKYFDDLNDLSHVSELRIDKKHSIKIGDLVKKMIVPQLVVYTKTSRGWFRTNYLGYEEIVEHLKSKDLAKLPPITRLPGSTWGWSGDLRNHLVNSHNIASCSLRDIGSEDLITIHDNVHNHRVTNINNKYNAENLPRFKRVQPQARQTWRPFTVRRKIFSGSY